MKLSKDQKRIIRSFIVYFIGYLVFYPLFLLLFGKPVDWGDYFIFAGAMAVVGALMCAFFVIGSRIPPKNDDHPDKQ